MNPRSISVSVAPMQMLFTRMPFDLSDFAQSKVSPLRAHFDAL